MSDCKFRFLKTPVALVLSLVNVTIAGCAYGPPAHARAQQKIEEPGLYRLTGWNGASSDNAGDATASDIDVNGEIGHPLTVYQPQAHCVSPTNTGWNTSSAGLVSGTFPPGLALDQNKLTISGIPTDRGHWIIKIKISGITCNNRNYGSLAQVIRFHITGTGQVNQ